MTPAAWRTQTTRIGRLNRKEAQVLVGAIAFFGAMPSASSADKPSPMSVRSQRTEEFDNEAFKSAIDSDMEEVQKLKIQIEEAQQAFLKEKDADLVLLEESNAKVSHLSSLLETMRPPIIIPDKSTTNESDAADQSTAEKVSKQPNYKSNDLQDPVDIDKVGSGERASPAVDAYNS